MCRHLLLAASVFALGFAPAPFPKPEPARGDLERLRGEWLLVSSTQGGKASGPRAHTAFVIAGDRLTVYQDGRFASEWRISLDSTRPGQIDFLRRLLGAESRIKGVYELDGDTLRFWSGPGDRPTDRDAGAPGVIHEVLRRSR